MKPFVSSRMTPEEKEVLEELTCRILKIPDEVELPSSVEIISCHHVVRALARFKYRLNLELVDGFYLDVFDHSWFVDEKGNVFDPYPVGTIAGSGFAPMFVAVEVARRGLYISLEGRKRKFLRKQKETGDDWLYNPRRVVRPYKLTSDFRKVVRTLTDFMK